MSDWRRSLDRASRSLLLREPYYGHLLVGVIKSAKELGCLLRVAPSPKQVFFEVCPERWEAASEATRLASLRHELVHLTLRHPLRSRDYSNLEVWGAACDLVVNQLIDPRDLIAPLLIEDFPELERGLTADAYYRALLPDWDTYCTREHVHGWGQCAREGGSHERWRDFAEMPSGVLSVLDTNVEQLLLTTVRRACRRGWGPLPSALVQVLSALGQPPELPWRRLLRLFIAQSGRTYIKNTIARPSKRYGTTPGTKVRRRHKLTVAIDTSGSVRDEEIATFFSEIYAIWRRGTTVHIVEADADVARAYPYRGVTPKQVAGRGGTSFDPAIAWSNEHRSDGLVYFTDGFAPKPLVASRCPLLWVTTSDGDSSHLPGRRVRLTT
ncbi:MAG: VWA-like domain-containing protein [Myxococcota bacterium]